MVKNIVKGKYKKISYFLLVICLMCLFDSVSAFGKQYKIRDYDVKITVPSDYDVIIKNEDNTAVYKKLGVNEKSINNYMEPLNIYFLATTQDLKKIIALTRKQDEGTKKYYNMTDLDSDIIDALAEGFAQGVKAEDYGIERVNDITYVKLKYDIVTVQNEH